MQFEITLSTERQIQLYEITGQIQSELGKDQEGVCLVYCPHTTAGLVINEAADPDVASDMERAFAEAVPDVRFDHAEGNSPAHYLSCITGSSLTIPVKDGQLRLGRWQGIFFCEFDGPRTRSVRIQMI